MPRLKTTAAIAFAALLVAPLGFGGSVAAQTATPAPVVCTAAPRTDAELAALAASPIAAATPVSALPQGDPVDRATAAAIQATLDQLAACGKAGNVNAALALFTDAYVVNVALAPETVPIVAGTPNAAGTPRPEPASPPTPSFVLASARTGTNGSVVALVLSGATPELMVFKQEGGMWKIDQANPFNGDEAATPAAELPAPVQTALTAAAAKLGVDAAKLTVVHLEPRDWPDTSLGCPEPGRMYAQVVTPGWLVVIAGDGQALVYHTDQNDHAVLCARAAGD